MSFIKIIFFYLVTTLILSGQCVVTNITDFYQGTIPNASNPLIDQGEITFRGFDGINNSGIYHYNNDTITLIPGNKRASTYDFHNGDIAYLVTGTNLLFEVYLHSNNQLTEITQSTPVIGSINKIDIHNGTVVWDGDVISSNPSNASNIFKYENGLTSQITFASNSREGQEKPSVSDDYIVWVGGNDETTSQIHALDRTNNQIRIISQEFGKITTLNNDPSVSNDQITWRSLNDFESFIHRYTGDTSEVISNLEFLNSNTLIDNGEIVWSGFINGKSEIFHYKNGKVNIISTTAPALGHRFPKISDGRVVWGAGDENGLLLYYWAGDQAAPIELSALIPDADLGTIQNSTRYAIWRNQIVWEAQKNGVSQIYRAICESECPIDLRLSNVIDSPGDVIPYAARDEIYSSQVVINGGLNLSAPEVFIKEEFTIGTNTTLEIDNKGCNTN